MSYRPPPFVFCLIGEQPVLKALHENHETFPEYVNYLGRVGDVLVLPEVVPPAQDAMFAFDQRR